MLVPTARQVDAFMRAIPAGTSMDVLDAALGNWR